MRRRICDIITILMIAYKTRLVNSVAINCRKQKNRPYRRFLYLRLSENKQIDKRKHRQSEDDAHNDGIDNRALVLGRTVVDFRGKHQHCADNRKPGRDDVNTQPYSEDDERRRQ